MEYRRKIKYFLIRKAAKLLIHLIIITCKLRIVGNEKVEKVRERNLPIIYVYWHRHIFVTIYRFKKSSARPLISLSGDGEIVAQIASEFGMNPVRGSSSKGGARAFIQMVNSIKEENSEVLITADGPKGPLRQIKDGTIVLAQKTGSVIIPIAWHGSRVKIFEKTWDKFKIPKPFSRITYGYGDPFVVPAKAKKEDFPKLKLQLKERVDALEEGLEHALKEKL